MPGPVKLGYSNLSGESVPPYGVVQFAGPAENQPNSNIVINTVKPTDDGPYAIDDGKGTTSDSAGRYGSCLIPIDNACWVRTSAASEPVAWSDVGPVTGTFGMDDSGAGYMYVGGWDGEKQRMLVIQKSGGGSGLTPAYVTEKDTRTATTGTPIITLPTQTGVYDSTAIRPSSGGQNAISPYLRSDITDIEVTLYDPTVSVNDAKYLTAIKKVRAKTQFMTGAVWTGLSVAVFKYKKVYYINDGKSGPFFGKVQADQSAIGNAVKVVLTVQTVNNLKDVTTAYGLVSLIADNYIGRLLKTGDEVMVSGLYGNAHTFGDDPFMPGHSWAITDILCGDFANAREIPDD